jgi:hypothetical protein
MFSTIRKRRERYLRHQLELGIGRAKEPDRNHQYGGRSFYFFDFDDNIAFLSTPSFIFHKETGRELQLSSGVFAQYSADIGVRGIYKDYRIDYDEETGTFRCFRDKQIHWVEKALGKKQTFVQDLIAALGYPDFHWKGPSWSCFYHAVFNQRPVSLITARGHHPDTVKEGIRQLVTHGFLPSEPNYLSLYPVSHPDVKKKMGLAYDTPIAKLKQAAIRASVKQALVEYGQNPYHRFGMSDDDPQNIRMIVEEMARLKAQYSEMSFYVIETHGGKFMKHEVFADHIEDYELEKSEQMRLFQEI